MIIIFSCAQTTSIMGEQRPFPIPQTVSPKPSETVRPLIVDVVRWGIMPTCMILVAADLLVIIISGVISWSIKVLQDPSLSLELYLPVLPSLGLGAVVCYSLFGLYPAIGLGPAEELRRIFRATGLVFLIAIALTFLSKAGADWSRQVFFVAWILAVIFVPIARSAIRRICCHMPWWGAPVVVLGAGITGSHVVKLLRARPWLGLRPVAVLDDVVHDVTATVDGIITDGPIVEKTREHAARGIRYGILAMPGLPPQRFANLMDELSATLHHVYIAPALPGSPDLIAEAREFANTLVLEVRAELLRPSSRMIKRTLDFISTCIGGVLISPLIFGIMLVIRLTSSGPIFYGQKRIGREGKEFIAWKFRSMVSNADQLLEQYLTSHPELRAEWERDHKLKHDPRVTTIGKILRATSFDELPQLWNVLCGEMSLVGPRPIVLAEVEKYGDRFALYKKVRPGLSGLWQVSGRNDLSYAERVTLDCYYVRNWSVWLDLVILGRTVTTVLAGKGAY